jgi:hypothetical protein
MPLVTMIEPSRSFHTKNRGFVLGELAVEGGVWYPSRT